MVCVMCGLCGVVCVMCGVCGVCMDVWCGVCIMNKAGSVYETNKPTAS